jgi:hypothetical protein
MIDPLKMTREQVSQVFAQDHLRDEAEQIAVLERRRTRPARRQLAHGKCHADRERSGIVVKRTLVPQADVIAALADLQEPPAGDTDDDESLVSFPIKLSPTEHHRLKVRAAQSQRSMQDVIRDSLRAMGVI